MHFAEAKVSFPFGAHFYMNKSWIGIRMETIRNGLKLRNRYKLFFKYLPGPEMKRKTKDFIQ
jgi:hypothetical protein